jgi:hypothetical protein
VAGGGAVAVVGVYGGGVVGALVGVRGGGDEWGLKRL